ncbi:MAG: phosphoribosylglycinamide formyltransferase [Defluviicoccus sp.]|nr:phosphoribosylglycinamide formyltransferase [Defluviicoccus sp.]MDE0384254.1 phosphoribosylglycinamide formyltransferase [Defluviicoccus sp.]
MARLRLAVLISGRGSNLQALIDACAAADYPAEIVLAVSNEPDAAGLERARRAGIPAETIDHREFSDRKAFERALDWPLAGADVGLVCLAGFMRLLTPWFVERWRDRLINIHPSLLPAFPGLDTHARALAAGVRIAGCTVHFVRPAMDRGPIVVQAAVSVEEGDDAASLAARVLAAEHRCLPLAVRLIAEGRVRVVGERCEIAGAAAPFSPLISPSPSGCG